MFPSGDTSPAGVAVPVPAPPPLPGLEAVNDAINFDDLPFIPTPFDGDGGPTTDDGKAPCNDLTDLKSRHR
jgi:hypothetical protein